METEDFDQADQLNLEHTRLQEKSAALYGEQTKAEAALHAAVSPLHTPTLLCLPSCPLFNAEHNLLCLSEHVSLI